ncbi:tRNA uracil 4-sulfurtransferase ThiI [Kitasatospora sp. NPDC056184]|uniref:tRNA uracil 4-sulfurtransferase ThiI n=1 Tax=Kitasatospora sp. NPDC056184 TaxID=3345738 RepID=UPI0035E2D5C6
MNHPTDEPRLPAARGATDPYGSCVLLKHGEVAIKGRNRRQFVRRLEDNLRTALRGIGGSTWIRTPHSITVLGGDVPVEDLVARARTVVGFNAVEPALRVPSTMESIEANALEVLRTACEGRAATGFAVRVKRRDKTFPLTSSQLERELGARLQPRVAGLRVDLTAPDVTLTVEIDRRETFLSAVRYPGLSGLPVGSSGRALVLLSGGYDSPVAAHRAMRRGLACDFVHFSGAPYTNPASVYKAYALARELNRYQPPGELHVVSLGKAQKQLAVAGAGPLQVVAQRRLMVRTASALAEATGAQALVTGDSLGQVASQTLANMAAVDQAATLPVLRPLVGWDKQEIIDQARALGTAAISVLPDEDCCSLLAPPRVSTGAPIGRLKAVERRLDLDEVVEALLANVQVMRPGQEEDLAPETGPGCTAPA